MKLFCENFANGVLGDVLLVDKMYQNIAFKTIFAHFAAFYGTKNGFTAIVGLVDK